MRFIIVVVGVVAMLGTAHGDEDKSSGVVTTVPTGKGQTTAPSQPAPPGQPPATPRHDADDKGESTNDTADTDGATSGSAAATDAQDAASPSTTKTTPANNTATSKKTDTSKTKPGVQDSDNQVKDEKPIILNKELEGRKINSIVVIGADKTTKETIISLAKVGKGDIFTYEKAQEWKRNLLLSGLFKEADSFARKNGAGVRLTLKVADKHSWIIAPTYYDQPTNRGGGIGYGENNLFGSNKKLLLYGQLATGDSFFIGAYVDPSIANSVFRWQLDVFLRDSRMIEYAAPQEWVDDPDPARVSRFSYLNVGAKLGFQLSKFGMDVRLRGAWVGYRSMRTHIDASSEDVFGTPMPGAAIPAPGDEGWDISSQLVLQYNAIEDWFGLREGMRIKATADKSLGFAGSDFDYWSTRLDFFLAKNLFLMDNRFFSKHNVAIKGFAGYGRNLPFQQEFLSGGTNQRGYLNDQFRGNLSVGGSLEYSLQFFEVWGAGIRLLAFWDTNYTAFTETASGRHYLPDHKNQGLAPFKNSVGFGTRMFIKQIVLPLLGVDVGYGLERGSYEIYLAIGLTDV